MNQRGDHLSHDQISTVKVEDNKLFESTRKCFRPVDPGNDRNDFCMGEAGTRGEGSGCYYGKKQTNNIEGAFNDCDRFDFKYKVVEQVKDKCVGGEVDEKYQVICRNCGSSGWGRRRRRDSYTSCCSDGRRRRHTKYATRRVCPEGRLTWGADKLRGQKQCSQGTCMSQDKATHFGQSNANQCDACTTTDKSANCNSAKSACLGSQMSPAVANPRSRQL